MKKPILIVGALLIALASTGGFGYEYYQWHYLSANLKRSLTAAFDQSASRDDVRVYNREARLQSRTKRDATVLAHFEQFVSLADEISETHARRDRAMRESWSLADRPKEYGAVDKLLEIRSQYWERHLTPPPSLAKQIGEALDQAREQIAQKQRDDEEEGKHMASQEAVAKQLYVALRKDLNMPEIREQK